MTKNPTDPTYSIIVFCDGACSGNPGPGGWGSVVCDFQTVYELGGASPQTTNNQMELSALIESLESLKGNKGSILILTDSVYVLRGATQWVHGWRKNNWMTSEGNPVANRELWERIPGLLSHFKPKQIQWGYVPGHKGVPGNERVDEIAVQFSQGQRPKLYNGPFSAYSVDLRELPADVSIPIKNYSEKEKKEPFSYLSLLNGQVERHKTWVECEKRVKGRSGAKFKKAMSQEEENSILRSWGVGPIDNPRKY